MKESCLTGCIPSLDGKPGMMHLTTTIGRRGANLKELHAGLSSSKYIVAFYRCLSQMQHNIPQKPLFILETRTEY